MKISKNWLLCTAFSELFRFPPPPFATTSVIRVKQSLLMMTKHSLKRYTSCHCKIISHIFWSYDSLQPLHYISKRKYIWQYLNALDCALWFNILTYPVVVASNISYFRVESEREVLLKIPIYVTKRQHPYNKKYLKRAKQSLFQM